MCLFDILQIHCHLDHKPGYRMHAHGMCLGGTRSIMIIFQPSSPPLTCTHSLLVLYMSELPGQNSAIVCTPLTNHAGNLLHQEVVSTSSSTCKCTCTCKALRPLTVTT